MPPFKVMGCRPTYAARNVVDERRPVLETARRPGSRPARAVSTTRLSRAGYAAPLEAPLP
jgi:hypothetical protein